MRRILIVAALLLIATNLSPAPLRAAELVMFEQQGCVYCVRWHEEIGQAYPKTKEGKQAPLRMVDIDEPLPEDLSAVRVERFTPTFVLVDQGVEIGRIRGYPGDEFFWFLLSELLQDLNNGPS